MTITPSPRSAASRKYLRGLPSLSRRGTPDLGRDNYSNTLAPRSSAAPTTACASCSASVPRTSNVRHRVTNDDAREVVAALKEKPGRDIWLWRRQPVSFAARLGVGGYRGTRGDTSASRQRHSETFSSQRNRRAVVSGVRRPRPPALRSTTSRRGNRGGRALCVRAADPGAAPPKKAAQRELSGPLIPKPSSLVGYAPDACFFFSPTAFS